eukprot:Sro1052_g235790.1 n/a (414) ;mRNA; r:7609-8850
MMMSVNTANGTANGSASSSRPSFMKRTSKGLKKLVCLAAPRMSHEFDRTPEMDKLSYDTRSYVGSNSVGTGMHNSFCGDETTYVGSQVVVEVDGPATPHPVPWHTQVLIGVLTAFFVAHLPTLESLDQVATVETFIHANFESFPLALVILVRLCLAGVMLGNAASVYLYGQWEADTDYIPGSKLRVVKRIPFRGALTEEGNFFSGFKCIATFTLWCWIVEGTAFLLAAAIPVMHFIPGTYISPWLLRVAIVLWQVGASVSILVSAVVKYALWPIAQEHGENIKLLKATGALLQHNLNSIAALIEVGLLGGLPVRLCDFAFPPLYGIIYLLFTYAMMYRWTDPKHGPQFFYPFFDTTLGAGTSFSLVALLAVLSASFAIFVGAEHLLTHAEKFIAIVPVAAIYLLAIMVCRVKD